MVSGWHPVAWGRGCLLIGNSDKPLPEGEEGFLEEGRKTSLDRLSPKGLAGFEGDQMHKLDEYVWCVLNDKLDGVETRGKLKGLREGDGLQAYQKVYKWYSAVTGVTLPAKMSLAVNPDKPKKISEVAGRLEKWSQLVNALENMGQHTR